MKTRRFEVPEELVFEFAKVLEEHELEGTIEQTTEDNELVIAVPYDEDDRDTIHELHDMIDDYIENNEEEEEETDED